MAEDCWEVQGRWYAGDPWITLVLLGPEWPGAYVDDLLGEWKRDGRPMPVAFQASAPMRTDAEPKLRLVRVRASVLHEDDGW